MQDVYAGKINRAYMYMYIYNYITAVMQPEFDC